MGFVKTLAGMSSRDSRKVERKQRALAKATQKETRLADKGKPTRRHRMVEQATQNVERQTAHSSANERTPNSQRKIQRLERHYRKLVAKEAQPEKLTAAAEACQFAKYREARVADMGRLHGFKRTAPRVTRRQTLIAA